jgi:hypothetical protein
MRRDCPCDVYSGGAGTFGAVSASLLVDAIRVPSSWLLTEPRPARPGLFMLRAAPIVEELTRGLG